MKTNPTPTNLQREKKLRVPCWLCKGSGITEEGERVDVGLGLAMVQVSADIECGLCDGEGLIVLGSKIHNEWRKNVMGLPKWRSK